MRRINRRARQSTHRLLHRTQLRMFVVCLLLVAVNAHICIIQPRQRGANFSITSPGSDDCFRRKAECGGIAPGKPTYRYVAGALQQVLIQQNFNHWYGQKQGHIDIAVSYVTNDPVDSDFRVLGSTLDFPAHEQVMQTNFSIVVRMPSKVCGHCVLRARYVSYNPDEQFPNNTDSTFYNCADIEIAPHHADEEDEQQERQPVQDMSAAFATPLMQQAMDPRLSVNQQIMRSLALAKAHAERHGLGARSPTAAPVTGCCIFPEMTLTAKRALSTDGVSQTILDTIEVSEPQQLQRYTQIPASDPNGGFYSITDYQKQIEYFVDIRANTCDDFGPDQFYPICYGDKAEPGTQHFLQQVGGASYFVNDDYSWLFIVYPTAQGGCYPIEDFHHNGTAQTLRVYTGFSLQVDPTHLQKPSFCK